MTQYRQLPPRIDLSISALVWHDTPAAFIFANEESKEFGRYELESQPVKLHRPTWSMEMNCFVFIPRDDEYAFGYGREKSIGRLGTLYTEHGVTWGQGNEVSPLIFLHRTDNPRPYIATMRDKYFNDYEADQPPFKFLTCSEQSPSRSFQSSAPHLQVDMPDLEHRFKAGVWNAESDSFEHSINEDGSRNHTGWGGVWASEVIHRVESEEALVIWEKEVWDSEGRWGVKLELETEGHNVEWKKLLGRNRLLSYGVRATLLEVYVKPEFLASAPL